MSNEFGSDSEIRLRPRPQATVSTQVPPSEKILSPELEVTKKKFNQQIIALAVVWLLFAVLCIAGAVIFLVSPGNNALANPVFATIIGGIGLLYALIGIGSCFKQIWAVWIGFIFFSLGVILNIVNLATGQPNLCGLVITVAIALQAYRVIGFAKELRDAGIPLRGQR